MTTTNQKPPSTAADSESQTHFELPTFFTPVRKTPRPELTKEQRDEALTIPDDVLQKIAANANEH